MILFSCSNQKNRFLNRQYHEVNTKYNVVFNGKQALSVGEEILNATVEDDFFEILKIDPIILKGESFDQNTIVPGFDKAEDKAVKAIQKHSMNIKGKQRNSRIDEAYLLLGKARYYDRRFFPAIEAFNFLLENNTDETVYIEGRIWREKTNIRLQNNQLAINNLRPLARKLINKNPFYGELNATLSQAFINLEELDSARVYITRAANHEKKLAKKARYAYIAGQLFEKNKSFDLAIHYYNSIVDLNWQVPRNFWINANINSLRLSHENYGSPFVNEIEKLLNIYENKNYYHSLNRALGVFYLSKENDSLVKTYLERSSKNKGIDYPTLRANHRDLADLAFRNKNYILTGSYLDSLIPLISKEGLKRKTQRERDNLSDVIYYENQFNYTDSLLRLLALNKIDQRKFFEDYLSNKRKIENESLIVDQEIRKGLFKSKSTSSFYFYNPSLVLKGKQYFASTWGKRPNIDNWRNKVQAQFKNSLIQKENTETKSKISQIEIESVDYYMNQLPKSLKIIDSLKEKYNQAALKLGLIYKEKYKDKQLAIKNLMYLVKNEPDTLFMPPALYHLHMIHLHDSINIANQFKNKLITIFPESKYSRVLLNPNNYELGTLKTPESMYLKILRQYMQGKYDESLETIDQTKILLAASKWEAKAMLIKANIFARLYGKKSFLNQLNLIIKEYPNSNIAKKAEKEIKVINQSFKEKTKTLAEFKWVFPFKKDINFKANQLMDSLKQNVTQLKSEKWKITNDKYNNDYQFLVIHGIKSKLQVDSIRKKLPLSTLKLLDSNNFVALSAQYRKIFIEKSWPKK